MAKSYKEKLRHPKWQEKRLRIMERDGFSCTYCGDKEDTQHVHHKKYTGKDPWDAPDEDLQTVCKCCHSILEIVKKVGGILVLSIKRVFDQEDCAKVFIAYIKSNCGSKSACLFTYEKNTVDWVASLGQDTISEIHSTLKKIK